MVSAPPRHFGNVDRKCSILARVQISGAVLAWARTSELALAALDSLYFLFLIQSFLVRCRGTWAAHSVCPETNNAGLARGTHWKGQRCDLPLGKACRFCRRDISIECGLASRNRFNYRTMPLRVKWTLRAHPSGL